MAENKLTESEKKRFRARVIESLLPRALESMFEEEIRNVWNAYVKSLCPNAPEEMFFKTNLILNEKSGTGPRGLTSIANCFYIDAPYVVDGKLDVSQCPCENLKIAVSAFLEFSEKREKLNVLLESKLLTINTRKALKEQLPSLYKYFDDGSYGAYIPVAIDIDAIDCVVAV